MSSVLPVPRAYWHCLELGIVHRVEIPPGGRQTWSWDDFKDERVGRSGVSLRVVDHIWTVTNHSVSMKDVYLLDLRYGKRHLPLNGALQLHWPSSWILLPNSAGPERPHQIDLSISRPHADTPRITGLAVGPDFDPARTTISTGEPSGPDLEKALERVRARLVDKQRRNLLAAYAWPYFTVSTNHPEPSPHSQVALCVPGDRTRGEKALTLMRGTLWGAAAHQRRESVIAMLIGYGLLTHDHLKELKHTPKCGHRPDDIDPTAPSRR